MKISRLSDIDSGDGVTVSHLSMSVHTGTHVDAPLHFVGGAEGIDAMSLSGAETHHILLGAGIYAIEGLLLTHIEPGEYDLVCLPLKILDADGTPARALIRPRRAELNF